MYFGQGCFLAYYVIAFRQAGLSLALIAVANSLFDVMSVICELPTSVLFDKWSGKKIMVLGAAARLVGFVCFLIDSSNFWMVVAGELLTGFGSSTETGAASALYVAEQEERERKTGSSSRTETKLAELGEAIGLSVIAGGAVGAVLYAVTPSLIWVGAGAAYMLAIVTLLRMSDMTVSRGDGSVTLRTLFDDMWRSVTAGIRVPECWMVVALDVGAMSIAMLWPLLLGSDYDTMWLQLIGLIAMNGGTALAGRLGRRFASTPTRLTGYLLADATCIAITAWTGNDALLIVAFFVSVCAHGMAMNAFCGKVYARVNPDERASVMSVVSLLATLCIAILQPLVGLLGQSHLQLAAMCTIPVFFVPMAYILINGKSRS